MGFTIGGIRERRSGSRRRGRTAATATAAEYTGPWGWAVAPGGSAADGARSCGACSCGACSCGEADGATPLPAGPSFDILDVAGQAGCRALVRMERMGLPLGPVAVTPAGRAQFFVAPGAAADLPRLLYRMGWDDAKLDLNALGSFVWIRPPSGQGAPSPVRWLRPPAPDTAAVPPRAQLLLGTLAYVCHRS